MAADAKQSVCLPGCCFVCLARGCPPPPPPLRPASPASQPQTALASTTSRVWRRETWREARPGTSPARPSAHRGRRRERRERERRTSSIRPRRPTQSRTRTAAGVIAGHSRDGHCPGPAAFLLLILLFVPFRSFWLAFGPGGTRPAPAARRRSDPRMRWLAGSAESALEMLFIYLVIWLFVRLVDGWIEAKAELWNCGILLSRVCRASGVGVGCWGVMGRHSVGLVRRGAMCSGVDKYRSWGSLETWCAVLCSEAVAGGGG